MSQRGRHSIDTVQLADTEEYALVPVSGLPAFPVREALSKARKAVIDAAKVYATQRGKPDMRRPGSPSHALLRAVDELLRVEAR